MAPGAMVSRGGTKAPAGGVWVRVASRDDVVAIAAGVSPHGGAREEIRTRALFDYLAAWEDR